MDFNSSRKRPPRSLLDMLYNELRDFSVFHDQSGKPTDSNSKPQDNSMTLESPGILRNDITIVTGKNLWWGPPKKWKDIQINSS